MQSRTLNIAFSSIFALFIFHKASSMRKLNLIKYQIKFGSLVEVALWKMENNKKTMCTVLPYTLLIFNQEENNIYQSAFFKIQNGEVKW